MPNIGTPFERRPKYIPAAVWRFYRQLEDRDSLRTRDHALITRLFGPDMELTWRNLARHVETKNPEHIDISPYRVRNYVQIAEDLDCTEREAIAEQDWRHLFQLLMDLRLSFDASARDAMKRAEELLGEIGDTAERLAELICEYGELRTKHEFSAPEEFSILSEWLRATTREDEPSRYDPAPADMIEALGFAAWYHELECHNETATHVHDRKYSYITAWIRHFDALWRRWQEEMAARFVIGDTDLARIASVVLRIDVSREAVSRARSRAKD